MTRLMGIQELAQQVADAISAALKIETEIIDETMTVVAATGQCKKRINTKEEYGEKDAGYLYGRVLTTNKAYVVEDARNDPTYDPSFSTGQIEEVAEICCPIEYSGEVIGVIGLIAFNETHHRRLMDNKEHMLNFLQRMAQLLTSKVSEREAVKQWKLATNKLNTLIESIHEGIIAIDEKGIITHCNRTAEILIRQQKESLIGKEIEEIWKGSPMLNVLKTGKGYTEKEEIYDFNNHHMHFVVTAMPIRNQVKTYGVVSSFRRMADVRKLAYSLTTSRKGLSFSDIIGESKVLKKVKKLAMQVSHSDSNIMLTGESGTGKDFFANAIHTASPRANGPFISVNCGAIPETLLESELFGYEKGAFTGANKEGKIGKFEMADGGTIFLDEIGDMPLHLQVKLLHVLQNKVIERVGGRKMIPVDVRVIAATNKSLETMIQEGEFRSDLYFRLNVIPLHIPPLRKRKEDIPLLMEHFLTDIKGKLAKSIDGFQPEVIALFQNYRWPGNVRELENAVEYAVNMETENIISAASIPAKIASQQKAAAQAEGSLKERLRREEKKILKDMLNEYGTSLKAKKDIASQLKISLATLYRKLEEHEILNNENKLSKLRN
ncbi:PAS domain S-box-containing protein [Scopulibacillus daqui]|uniref:PAS domain S-box-containing protein n=1 Tax=Scopulibacillus daqui TaxID=1469162 RepID=A0ABS2Q2V0_9BACL|nr:sigma 54-interacting transcriptional regulator [Scopulibacillus daqui]MBM7646255.1 PAS domain S-box-containing protein [Scopulibacillus daqui]